MVRTVESPADPTLSVKVRVSALTKGSLAWGFRHELTNPMISLGGGGVVCPNRHWSRSHLPPCLERHGIDEVRRYHLRTPLFHHPDLQPIGRGVDHIRVTIVRDDINIAALAFLGDVAHIHEGANHHGVVS